MTVSMKNMIDRVFIVYKYSTAPCPIFLDASLRLLPSSSSESESESGTNSIDSGFTYILLSILPPNFLLIFFNGDLIDSLITYMLHISHNLALKFLTVILELRRKLFLVYLSTGCYFSINFMSLEYDTSS